MFNSFICSEFISLICLVVHITSVATTNNVVADTKQGKVKGVRQEVEVDNKQKKIVYKFLGVPYAQKPIGDLRFKPPQALSARRSSDYEATSLPLICIQANHYFDSIKGAWPEFDPTKDMSEDCLYLNIYTPSIKSCKKKYPVIFYIHGGSYFAGTPTRDISPGEYLPTRDVVLVTIQYRLGPFGFFTTGDSEAPGNVGLLDQVEALKWVQQNIEGFCGDKNSVTLLGESAGGSSVGLHYLSPLSRGLFHRGIAVSGVEFSPFAFKPKSTVLEASNNLIEKVNCRKQSLRETVGCLKSIPSATVFENSIYWLMQPFVDQHFLPDDPKTLRKEGRFQKLPLMSGFTSQDASFVIETSVTGNYSTPKLREFLDDHFQRFIGYAKEEAKDAYNALVAKYELNVEDTSELRQNLIDMLSDYYMKAPTHAVLSFHSDKGASTFMFEFAYRSKLHPKPEWMGVVHEDTTAYKFGLPLLNSKTGLKFDKRDQKVSDVVVTMFTNFAKFGNPTPIPVRGAKWDPFDSSKKAYLKIRKNPVMKNNYRPRRMNFWNSEFPSLLPKGSKKEHISSGDAVKKRGKPNFEPLLW
ncbi:cholinesterase 1-like [Actinia tenebrosa]|uniref:Cholinesterase 1-like n=1 Tax=Actinia tenebrosa TaxID=6105 RepID=A0A6P8HWH6_ACTTE|nr:cholinesterase 1-like [Actinia tenebrosa]